MDAMRLLLDHPSADPPAMLGDAFSLKVVARGGHVDAMRLLLDHPSADRAAMLAVCASSARSTSALIGAAAFAARGYGPDAPSGDCKTLLFLLRCEAVEAQPSDAQEAHMRLVMERLKPLLEHDNPCGVRDECIRLLLARGAGGYDPGSPVMSRIIRELAQLARAPHLINEAVMGMAAVRQRQQ